MGILKFPFPNPEDIYLHDTPDHAKFALANRNLSNGCVRVEDARRLGRWLLGSRARLRRARMPKRACSCRSGTPIYLTYITAQVQGRQAQLPARHLRLGPAPPPQFASSN